MRVRIALLLIVALLACVAPARADVPVVGDLSNLTYTATGDLKAELVSPADHSASPTIAARILVSTVAGAGVELRVNGRVIPS
ncbi:MAG: hypothetical protein JO293_05980, partial [Candidatus Eremiobacteraeota bacterium]|nr:hypothetical protein [Candidatus Eremiobacteraeota bacterium]